MENRPPRRPAAFTLIDPDDHDSDDTTSLTEEDERCYLTVP